MLFRSNERVVEEDVVENIETGGQVDNGLEEEDIPGNVEGYVELFDNGPGLSDISGGESNGNGSIEGSSDEDDEYVKESSESDCDESVVEEFGEIVGDNSNEESEEEDEGELDDVVIPAEIRGEGIEHTAEGNGVVFEVGMCFLDKAALRKSLDTYAILNGVNLRVVMSNKRKVLVMCAVDCPFKLYASKVEAEVGYTLRTLCREHNCSRVYKNRRASVRWLAEVFKEKVLERPQFKVSEMKMEVERTWKGHVSIHKCKRAKRIKIGRAHV